jgi:hypothetical protein
LVKRIRYEQTKPFHAISARFVVNDNGDDGDFLLGVTHVAINADESDDEPKHRGSILGHQVLWRDREVGHQILYQDYFSENPTYGHIYFRRRYVNNKLIDNIFI